MTAPLVALTIFCTLLLAACAYLFAERKSDKGLIGRQDDEIRRLIAVSERWQDKLVTSKGMTPINQPLPPREHKPPNPNRVAFTPQQASERYEQAQREKSAEQSQGEAAAARVRELTEHQKTTALSLAATVKPNA